MKEKDFKKTFKPPACTMAPWYNLIPVAHRDTIMRQIRQETIEAYGYPMDECPKRKTCLTKSCMGRPLPWKSETAKPYLEQLKATHNIKNDELFLVNCDTCPIVKTCKSPCHQINDYLNRAKNKEPELVAQNTLENYSTPSIELDTKPTIFQSQNVPWDCLTDTRQSVVKKYLYEGKDFLTISKELDLTNQARVKYEFYSALTRLSEFAVMRKFIDDYADELTHKQRTILIMIYKANLSLTSIASIEDTSKQAVQQVLTRVVDKYNIRWTVFVRRENGKTIYNVPGLFK